MACNYDSIIISLEIKEPRTDTARLRFCCKVLDMILGSMVHYKTEYVPKWMGHSTCAFYLIIMTGFGRQMIYLHHLLAFFPVYL